MRENFRLKNVGRGRFAGADKVWLSPEDYEALSSVGRRELWARRMHERRYRPTPARFRKGYYARQRWMWGALVFGGIGLFQLIDSIPMFRSPTALVSSVAPSITGRFGTCKWGGGVNCVVDGDSIWIDGQNIRIADIDAPENHEPRCAEEQALGDRAAARLHQLVNSGAVTMSSIDRDEDRYGRKLRIVEVSGTSVGETLVGEGLARWYQGGRRSWCG